jgi:hypothetical protein
MEKIHGTSAHVAWAAPEPSVRLFSGGEAPKRFAAVFGDTAPTVEDLGARFAALGVDGPVVVYGEAYGGKCQGMGATYGPTLRFVAFDVKIGHRWLDVEDAAGVVGRLGLDFVPFASVPASTEALDLERDRPSRQAAKLGIVGAPKAEGIVIRPFLEAVWENQERIIAKHKRMDFQERKSQPRPLDPTAAQVLLDAEAVADEWVTERRLDHVLDHLGNPDPSMANIPKVAAAMVEDVLREASGEISDTKAVRKAISATAVQLYKARVGCVRPTSPLTPASAPATIQPVRSPG